MPVRIYDIAKKLGLESKVVLAKAKEFGITAAKVPSSSLDKITAEYLVQQLSQFAPPPMPVAAPLEPTPVVIVRLPDPPPIESSPGEEGMPSVSPLEGDEARSSPAADEPVVASEAPLPTAAEVPVAAELTANLIAANKAASGPAAALGSTHTTVPPTGDDRSAPPADAPVANHPVLDHSAPPASLSPPAASPVASPSTPPIPSAPVRPQIGEKVGFINLGNLVRNRPGETRGRDDRRDARPGTPPRPGQPGQRPATAATPSRSASPPPAPAKPQLAATAPTITLRPPIVVRELAEKMGRKPFQVIADLMGMGVFATVTQTIDTEVAIRVCAKNGFRFETEKRDKAAHVVNVPKEQKVELDQEDRPESLKSRPPVITIMGHVDHGKTTLLDVIRKANVASSEAGGITQHIGAYTISYPHPQRKNEVMQLTFLDTPGHAAFSAMRARGANVTDIVVLVVAANDGVMPQTLEALSHAQAARVPIIVAVNKCDHPNANAMRVRQQLQEKGLVPDDWGGDTLYVDCSAITKQGIDKLIDSILLQAELLELKANPDRKAKGNVIESGVEPGGPVATVLVRKGTLRVGDVVICGEHYGRVRAMMNEEGQRLPVASPSVAVRVLGLNGVPEAGSEFSAVENERAARDLAEERTLVRKKTEHDGVRPKRQTLEDIFGKISDMTAKVLKVVVKADTQGSVEAICDALSQFETTKVTLEIIHSAVGAITPYDVLLASSSDAVILGFHTRVDSTAAEAAKREGVQIKLYAIIYELIDQVKEAMAGLLDPLLKEVVIGQAEVRKVFTLSKGGHVAGCSVTNGRIVRGKMRVRRRSLLIYEGVSLTLKRFQDEVSEVRSGMECGIRLEGFEDFQEGDIIECYGVEKVAQKL